MNLFFKRDDLDKYILGVPGDIMLLVCRLMT